MKDSKLAAVRWAEAVAGGALIAVLLVVCASWRVQAADAADQAFARFWSARTPADAAKAAEAIAKSGVTFDAALQTLKRGRPYSADVPKGVVRASHTIAGTEFPYMLDVPETYTPAKQYQVRVQLHGGVGRPDAAPRGSGIGQLAGVEQIYVLPTAWSAAEWWTDRQLENLRTIVDDVKRTYNIDENHVVLSGVSDGGTACYYFAMRDTTPFAAFLPLNGALAVLRNLSLHSDGELFPNNFLDKPFFIVNGGRDPLYPAALVEPFIEHLSRGGVDVTYVPQPNGVHNTAWWPDVKDTFEQFVHDHPRRPYPDTLTWESDLTAGTGRAHWLVIDRIAEPREGPNQAFAKDLNDFNSGPMPDFGLRVSGTRVTSVGENSNASIFNFERGDEIVTVNGDAVPQGANALEVLSKYEAGRIVRIGVMRNGQRVELSGILIAKGEPRVSPLFRHSVRSGRVDLVKQGNTVRATTRDVAAFTLLLSPDAFDFAQPVTVVANGTTVFNGRVTANVATLMKWAAHDNDRTMLFGAELPITLPR